MPHVPYRGGGQALIDLLGGQVQVMFVSMSFTSSMDKFATSALCHSSPLSRISEHSVWRYDRKALGTCGSSTRSNLAGRRTPSGGGDAVPPSVMK